MSLLRSGLPGERLARGVWVLPYMGPNYELILVAVQGDGRALGEPVMIPWGADSVKVAEDLWDLLDAVTEPSAPALLA